MTNLNLFNSIIGFQRSYNIINDSILKQISSNEKNLNSINDIYIEHLINLKNITDFSKIKYFENNQIRQQENRKNSDPISEKNIHFRRQLRVLQLVPNSLSNDIEKSRIALFIAWNNGMSKKKFPVYEFDNYIQKYRNYCEIVSGVLKNKNYYDALVSFNHPRISCEFLEKVFHKAAGLVKKEYKFACENSKNIKISKLDSFLIKDEQYKDIFHNVKCSFDLDNECNSNYDIVDGNFLRNSLIFGKSDVDFQQNIINELMLSSRKILDNRFCDKSSLFESYNSTLLINTISYFFSFYLLKSKCYIGNFSDLVKRVVRCKSKISDSVNLYWIFNKQSNDINMENHNEVSQMFFNMIQYIIERDLINGQIIGSDIEEIWMSGVKNYFGNDVDVQPWHILQNRNWGFGKLCRPGLDTISILGGAMMFDQYSKRVLNAEYDKNIIKKFLNNIDISNIDYSTSAMIDETMNNVDIFVKHLKEKFI